MAELNLNIDTDMIADAIAFRLLQSNRVMAKLTERLLQRVKPAILEEFGSKIAPEFDSALRVDIARRFDLINMTEAVKWEATRAATRAVNNINHIVHQEVRQAVSTIATAELNRRVATMTNDELTCLLKNTLR